MDDNPGVSLFQGTTINVENDIQNQEEAEDLEDQKRRQEEIQNLLTVAMDEFNYDDQSTINSTNVSIEESYPNKYTIEQKYKNASFDDQLKVLYEVRVREVKSLTEQLQSLKSAVAKEKDIKNRKIIVLEAEKDKAQLSLQQSQALLVSKTEETESLKNELADLKEKLTHSEDTVKKLNEENDACEHLNKDLMDQLTVMHRGITVNTISDRQFQEKHHTEITQFQTMLDTAHMKLERKEREYKELQQNFKAKCQEKDSIMVEKCSIINILTENLEGAQQQCHELLQIIDKLSRENKTLASANDLTDSIKYMGLADKTEMVKALQKELDKARDIQNKQNFEFDELQRTCVQLSENYKNAEQKIEQYKGEIALWTSKNAELEDNLKRRCEELQNLRKQLDDFKNIKAENEVYENKVTLLQNAIKDIENRQTEDHSVQVSKLSTTLNEIEKEDKVSKEELHTAYKNIEILKRQLSDADDQISKLSMTASLEIERDKLIKTLQEKAAQFEKIIVKRQYKPESVSVAINTEQMQENQILQAKYEADLIEKEIQLRIDLQKVYDTKLEKFENELSNRAALPKSERCDHCNDIMKELQAQELLFRERSKEMNLLKSQKQQDREAVATLLEEWRDKLLRLETEKQEISTKYLELTNYCDHLGLKLKTREAGDIKLYEVIKRECEETIKQWNKYTLSSVEKYLSAQQNRIRQTQKRMDECSDYFDKEVYEIERQFLHKKEAMELFHKK